MTDKATLLNEYWTDIYFHLHYVHKEKISHQMVRILQLIDKKEETAVKQIASFLQVSPNTASEHVKRMIEKDYIHKRRDALDERKVILCLTELGAEILHRNTSLDKEKLEQVWNGLNANEKILIEESLKLFSKKAKQCTSS
ncbi:MarR family transcriptional regulator [Bacillus sp. LL01]|uniref:MarR family winged helix-turn-helix transcriptional regulator n=1 Tax=Bacillus sp. LL01 TaxID=1665556 RepID=UPI00064D4180|nr:MarR family transcriptional regulator [Bacillus sp. LL01]KMJ57203.1 MarR family transcriptional regulator [Bacillus sp. LL01]